MRRSDPQLPAFLALFLLAAASCVGELPEIPEEGSLEDRVGVLESRVEALEEENAELRREVRRSEGSTQSTTRPTSPSAVETPTSPVSLPQPPEPEPDPEPDPEPVQEKPDGTNERWAVEVLEVTSRVTEEMGWGNRFAWRLTARNHTEKSLSVDAEIKFFDADGYIVDTDFAYNLDLGADEERTYTGEVVIDLPAAENVARVGAELSL